MISEIHLLLWNIKQQLIKYRRRNDIDPKFGISDVQRRKIQNSEWHQSGTIMLFSKPFTYSRNSSLLHSLDEIFGEEVYRFASENPHPLILDCGANVGLSILYFRRLFPQAKIIAFEPDENIFKMLQKNVDSMDNNQLIELHNAAVWNEDTELNFQADGGLAGKLTSDAKEKEGVVSVKAIDIKKYLGQKIDFLKIDIEGAENTLIFDIQDHLHHVKNLFLEYHGYKNANQNLGDILNLLTQIGFRYYIRVAGENKKYPFIEEEISSDFDIQLNIFCTRN